MGALVLGVLIVRALRLGSMSGLLLFRNSQAREGTSLWLGE